jgi:hypothetical protein
LVGDIGSFGRLAFGIAAVITVVIPAVITVACGSRPGDGGGRHGRQYG